LKEEQEDKRKRKVGYFGIGFECEDE